MRERIKKFIALVMAIFVLNQMPGFEPIIAYAATVEVATSINITEDSDDTYSFAADGASITIDEGNIVEGIQSTIGGSFTVNNNGTVNSLNSTNGALTLYGGIYGNITLSDSATSLRTEGISAGTVTSSIGITFVDSTITNLSTPTVYGSGGVTVAGELTLTGTLDSNSIIYVNADTVINSTESVVVYVRDAEGIPQSYTIAANSVNSSVESQHGVFVDVSLVGGISETPEGSFVMPGNIVEYVFTAAEGYYFPEGYESNVTSDGTGELYCGRISEMELSVMYYVENTDSGTVTITLPLLNTLEEGAGNLTVADVYVGETVSYELESSTNPTEGISVMYKLEAADETDYSTTPPTQAGEYVAKVVLPSYGIYDELVLSDTFTISRKDGQATFDVSDIIYGNTIIKTIDSSTHDKSTAVVEYKTAGTDDSAYNTNEPKAVGDYTARMRLPETDTYGEVVLYSDFSISKATGKGEFNVADISYGETISPQYSSSTQDTSNAKVVYKKADADDSTYIDSKPVLVGEYVAKLTIPASDTHTGVTLTDTFEIVKAQGDVSFKIEDTVFNNEIVPQISSTTHNIQNAVVQYKESGADDSAYVQSAPTTVGNYIAKVLLAATESHEGVTATDEFSIVRAEGQATFSVADIKVGGVLNPQYTSQTQDVSGAIVEYKLAGAGDATYTVTKPVTAGSYIAKVTIPANDSYNAVVMTDEFVIEEEITEEITTEEVTTEEITTEEVPETGLRVGLGSLTISNVYYGTSINPQISSNTNSITGAVVEYKKYDANDATYTTKVPTALGKYVARVILPANDKYRELVLKCEFSIDYLPIPEDPYVLSGDVGTNGYYTSEVAVIAKEGYMISTSLEGTYSKQVVINSSTNVVTVYLMDIDTGAKTSGISLSAFNIDVYAPDIDVDGDDVYYADSLAVAITDVNLTSVSVNGENVILEDNTTVLNLKSNGGVEEYVIVVTDIAGHTRSMTIVVASEWTKTGKIPNGSMVKLEAGQSYSLGSGTWTVDGDSTSYSGNTTFYVGGDGQYTFNQH